MQSQVPSIIAAYFERHVGIRHDHPIIVQAYRPDGGWRRYPIRKHVSLSWLRKMRAEGYTAIAVQAHDRTVDFTIREVIEHAAAEAKRPMFTGRLIG